MHAVLRKGLHDRIVGERRLPGGDPAKLVVWEHNSPVGDARATEVAARGELNVGQLVREHLGTDCRNLGFTTYSDRDRS